MISKEDKKAIAEAKKRIKEQVEATAKLDLGLDADRSSAEETKEKSIFDGFINPNNQSSLEDK